MNKTVNLMTIAHEWLEHCRERQQYFEDECETALALEWRMKAERTIKAITDSLHD